MEDTMDKSTISLETDRDKDISTLSYTKAKCLVNLRAGFCHASECASCRTGQRFTACYESLPVCDQLNVDNQAGQIAAVLYEQVGNKQESKGWNVTVICILVTAILCIAAMLFSLYRDNVPYKRPSATIDLGRNEVYAMCKPVYDAMERLGVWDINHDDKVNCIDSALLFKLLWDSMNVSSNCQVIENYNGSHGYHHLFNRVRVSMQSDWYYIEPQHHDFNTFTNIVNGYIRNSYDDKERTTRWLMEIATGEISNQTWLKIKNILGE